MDDAYAALEAKNKAATPEQQQSEAFKTENNKAEMEIGVQEAAINKKFIQDNPDSYISLIALEGYAYSADYPDIAALFNGLTFTVQTNRCG